MTLSVDGCGVASSTSGSGFVFDDGLVLTAGHVVARAEGIEVKYPDGSTAPARVIAFDAQQDLAALSVPIVDVDRPLIGVAGAGNGGRVVGALTSGTVDMTVRQRVKVNIEAVLGTERATRLGYEVEVATATGDSGAGVYDLEGRLLGMVFAVSAEGGTTWVTAAEELDRFVSRVDRAGTPYICDPNLSRLVSQ